MNRVRVYGYGLRAGWADFTVFWNWRSWSAGWMLRIVSQAAFFALIGQLLDAPDRVRYLVIGNGVAVGALAVGWTIPSSTWDRGDGTYPLLVVAPSSLLPAITGRTSIWLCNGVATSLVSLAVLGVVFDIEIGLMAAVVAVPLVVLTCVSVYCFDLLLGSLINRAPRTRNVVHNSVLTMLTALCGVSVPVAFWPGWLEVVANVLPLTHGLAAIRLVFDSGPLIGVAREAALEVVVGAGWLMASLFTMDRMANAGRADGTIEFAQ
jgi:ABC-2 type transport system permease protein